MKKQLHKLLLVIAACIMATETYARDVEVDGICYYFDTVNKTAGVTCHENGNESVKYSGDVVIPSQVEIEGVSYSVTGIGGGAFENCTDLTSVSIPGSVTSIGFRAFYGCTGLTSVTIPNSVTIIGSGAFRNCTGLTSISLPGSVTSIGSEAFRNCISLASATIPASVTSIGDYLFCYCTGLTSVTIPASVTSIGEYAFCSCESLTSVTIPESVTRIKFLAFAFCYGLTSVTLPGSLETIESYAFHCCTGLPSITIPESVKSVGMCAFAHCAALTSIEVEANNPYYGSTDGVLYSKDSEYLCAYPAGKKGPYLIPNSVEYIESGAFRGCEGLTSVTIPGSVKSIDGYSFYACINLKSIDVEADNARYSSTDGVLYNKDQTTLVAFPAGRTGSFLIPHSVTSIGDDAFSCCTGLTSVTIPNSVTSIGDAAFHYCYGLSSITIPNSVTSIERYAFADCNGLTSFYMASSQPPMTADDALEGVPSSCVVYVPTGAREAYSGVYPWSAFAIEEYDAETGIGSVDAAAPTAVGYYDLHGRRLHAPAKGLHVVRYSDGTTRKVFVK